MIFLNIYSNAHHNIITGQLQSHKTIWYEEWRDFWYTKPAKNLADTFSEVKNPRQW